WRTAPSMSRFPVSSLFFLTGGPWRGMTLVLSVRATTFAWAFDHPVDVPAGRVVDEGIDAIPVRIPTMKNIGFREGDGDVAIRMRGPIVLQGKFGTVQVNRHV